MSNHDIRGTKVPDDSCTYCRLLVHRVQNTFGFEPVFGAAMGGRGACTGKRGGRGGAAGPSGPGT